MATSNATRKAAFEAHKEAVGRLKGAQWQVVKFSESRGKSQHRHLWYHDDTLHFCDGELDAWGHPEGLRSNSIALKDVHDVRRARGRRAGETGRTNSLTAPYLTHLSLLLSTPVRTPMPAILPIDPFHS